MSMSDNPENPQTASHLKELFAQLPEQAIETMIAEIVAEKVQEERSMQALYQQFSGPIPPPQVLSGYDQIQAGFAERIVSMAEKEQTHRHGLELQALNSSISIQKRGQFFALLLSLLILTISGFLIHEGKELAGSQSLAHH